MAPRTIQIYTSTTGDGRTRVQTRRVGWLGRAFITLVVLAVLALALLVAIPLLLAVLAVGVCVVVYWRVKLALAGRSRIGAGRRNVRVVRGRGQP